MENNKILIFGGTGSLGYEINKRYLDKNEIYNYSRDEHKHWKMKIHFNNHKNLNFIIGNVLNKDKIKESINRIKPDIIIIASAMKHIDQCEINIGECINTNLLGTKYILDTIEELGNVKTVLFVSSDKACNPINSYGMCKAMSENLVIEKSLYIKNIKFVNIRYGNVLNSNGSIIPRLHLIGKDDTKKNYELTNENMTRFVMTLKDSVDLIEHAILNGNSGDTIISELKSLRIKDLFEIFAKKYNKEIKITGLRSNEKILEQLINKTQSTHIYNYGKYTHIYSINSDSNLDYSNMRSYNSDINTLSKDELENYLIELNLL
jgi:FlaA1/EpsC-like NDP-sugar epimerase